MRDGDFTCAWLCACEGSLLSLLPVGTLLNALHMFSFEALVSETGKLHLPVVSKIESCRLSNLFSCGVEMEYRV